MQRVKENEKYGNLVVIECKGLKDKSNHYISKVKCKCGNTFFIRDTFLINKKRKKCKKCSNYRFKHGMTNTRIFNIWQSMKERCKDKNEKNYKIYASRNIDICEQWKKDFESFYKWAINNGYKDNLSIDRIDNNKGYNPENCRWVDNYVQANNKRNNIIIYYKNKRYTLANLAREYNMNPKTLRYRLNRNWDIEKALILKPRIGRNQYG